MPLVAVEGDIDTHAELGALIALNNKTVFINNIPVIIKDVQDFLDNLISVYFEAVNEYQTKFAEIKKKRNVKDLVEL
jgi:hypothetical protein